MRAGSKTTFFAKHVFAFISLFITDNYANFDGLRSVFHLHIHIFQKKRSFRKYCFPLVFLLQISVKKVCLNNISTNLARTIPGNNL